ncbi:hypothetical protein [Solitalea canadensis]|uniref:Uncharacterized protein n=1 Tax=Solitalea canadensis (strain ATCC 29591 / DSM 3403 / JCM 21819 / LMG 8368 / NBRC 15130 / NCIMB 12057 / USAM 9D) TaxID=929556 RepID=H8KRZ5_SOLCM|nr:hypothetical protein [Solitalea canadensis]AFD07783.1 hypothetical protein Solca_2754 [Solitalea canadensis DSM 3403]
MKTKFTLLTVLGIFLSFTVKAQTSDAEAEAMANLLGVQKKEAVSKLVPVSGKDSINFWKIYDEYQRANMNTIKKRIKLYEATAKAYQNMTPKTADSLALQYFANREDQEKSIETYYHKIKNSTNAITAFEFYQAETYLLTQLRASIMQQVPTYGELQKALKKL